MDTSRIGQLAAELMEEVAERHPESEIGEVLVIAEIEDDEGITIDMVCSDDRRWVQLGLAEAASLGISDCLGGEDPPD